MNKNGPLIHEWRAEVRNLLLFVALFLSAIAICISLLALLAPELRPAIKEWTEIVRNMGLGLFGLLGGAFGLYIAYLRSVAAKEQADAALKAAKTAQEKEDRERTLDQEIQFAESFAKAVEQLGHSDVSVKLGAIHALALLAKQSNRDHWPIMSILASHIRGASDQAFPGTKAKRHLEIQLCIRILGSRNIENDPNGEVLDLRDSDLREVEFINLNFSSARFGSANFTKAKLEKSNFSHCEFSGSYIEGASIVNSNLSRSRFSNVKWNDGFLISGDFSHVSFFQCNLTGIQFRNAKFSNGSIVLGELKNVRFIKSNLEKATFYSASLEDCIFKNLQAESLDWNRSNFKQCRFSKIDASKAKLEGASFESSKFWNVDLKEANLKGATFVRCGFANTDLNNLSEAPKSIDEIQTIAPTDSTDIPFWLS